MHSLAQILFLPVFSLLCLSRLSSFLLVFLISGISSWFFLIMFMSLLILPIYSCILFACSIRILSIVIICCSVVQLLSCIHLFAIPWTGSSVLRCLLESAQVHVHWVCDAIYPSYPLPPSSFAFSLSQHQGLFQWVIYLHQVARVLELQFRYQSF